MGKAVQHNEIVYCDNHRETFSAPTELYVYILTDINEVLYFNFDKKSEFECKAKYRDDLKYRFLGRFDNQEDVDNALDNYFSFIGINKTTARALSFENEHEIDPFEAVLATSLDNKEYDGNRISEA